MSFHVRTACRVGVQCRIKFALYFVKKRRREVGFDFHFEMFMLFTGISLRILGCCCEGKWSNELKYFYVPELLN